MPLTINGQNISSLRWNAGWSGVWTAEITLISDEVPTGSCVITNDDGTINLVGTVDDTLSGAFGERRACRVLAGAGGWQKMVRAQHYHSDIGLQFMAVASATASEVGETVTVLEPPVLGPDFVRRNGPASQIFAGITWWVGLDGITRVGKRPQPAADPSLMVQNWDPSQGTATFVCDVLVEPGTVITDSRFGTLIVQSVEDVISNGAVSGTLFLRAEAPTKAGAVNELMDNLATIARAATRIDYSRFYEFRVVAMAGDRVELQAVNPSDGIPDLIPVSVWAGTSGYKAALTPSSQVLVGFRGGDPQRPFIAFYEPPENDGWRPVELNLDATDKVSVGEQSQSVEVGKTSTTVAVGGQAGKVSIGEQAGGIELAGGSDPIALAPAILTFASALKDAVDAAASAADTPPTDASPLVGSALSKILKVISAAIEVAQKPLSSDCPSKKVTSQ